MINEIVNTLCGWTATVEEKQRTRDFMREDRNYRRICIISYFHDKGYIDANQQYMLHIQEAYDAYERKTGKRYRVKL